jgi:hypothetical protein
MLVQWIPLAILDSDLKTILRAVALVFPRSMCSSTLPARS